MKRTNEVVHKGKINTIGSIFCKTFYLKVKIKQSNI